MKVGDTVTLNGYSGFCDRYKSKVEKILQRFDEKTGDPYSVIVIEGGQKFDGRNGFAITPPTAYHIEELLKK